jgi:peptidyl-dipeptidase Dcp
VPAFEWALPQHLAEIDAIAANTEAPTFDNTLAELDVCGRALERITLLFHNLTASETLPESYADYELVDRVAGKTSAVLDLLHQAWEPAKACAEADRAFRGRDPQVQPMLRKRGLLAETVA